ncbi:hypothetical protein DV735_g4144, partial [Chaetothyriales sp. CBS 134920]
MSSTATVTLTTASQVRLSKSNLDNYPVPKDLAGSLEAANRLLQRNHDSHHIFWRDLNGHNHMAHSLLSILALGGSPADIQRAYDDGLAVQRPLPKLDPGIVDELADDGKFYARLGQIDQYSNFLVFFEQEIEKHGWQAVINQYVFGRTKLADAVLARLYEGAYHPIIHLGLGIEFEQPSIVAEGLAQAATHSSSRATELFEMCEREAEKINPTEPSPPLIDLLNRARENNVLRTAARWEDFANKFKDGVVGRGGAELAPLAAKFRVRPEEVERRCAEMVNCVAYISGAAQRADKVPKIDFFHMHAVTSSIFLTVMIRQPWISIADKSRLVEWKGRLDIAWYVASGCGKLHQAAIYEYEGQPSGQMDWEALYRAINAMHDDGHVAKFVRALKSGEETSRPFEHGPGAEAFPIKGEEAWLKLARMTYDSTLEVPVEQKWVWGTGFDQAWGAVPNKAAELTN